MIYLSKGGGAVSFLFLQGLGMGNYKQTNKQTNKQKNKTKTNNFKETAGSDVTMGIHQLAKLCTHQNGSCAS